MTRPAPLALLFLAALAVPAAARDLYPSDLAKREPAMARALRSAIPAAPEGRGWLSRLEGTAGPLQAVEVDGRPYKVGYVCKPGDCRGNRFVFLIAPDGSRATGLLRLTGDDGTAREVETGGPGLLEADALRRRLDE